MSSSSGAVMSRSRRNRTRGVYTPSTANPRLRSNYLPSSLYSPPLKSLLRLYEDRRTSHPDASYRVPKSFVGSTRLKISPQPKRRARPRQSSLSVYPSPSVSFVQPDKVLVCIRRHIRREVLHAFNKAGRSGQRPPRRNFWSAVHC